MASTNHASDSPPRKSFGLAVRKARESVGLSQEALAEEAGLHRTYVSSVERGQRNVSLDNICRIAKALSTTPSELFRGIS